ncbi:Serine/threonine-protein kinase PrkC [Stieleria maiorica]|uniref:non-specific serine/threonine protein kinase n=1 Tax=Stieleria maiorica TaxID=2795974 RepID=A0A5B9M8U3_9BACT|nr:serine/threonine-protein kinase [Stieleria maiorica]QEF96606.1 Serine/threonine-protein kinase PrkC [Stieleria maiorica]
MKTKRTSCRVDQIEAFLAGSLPDAELAQLEQHLETCTRCDAELTRRTADESFWDDARAFLHCAGDIPGEHDTEDAPLPTRTDADDGDPSGDRRDALGGAVGFLDPTDDPNMLGRFGGYEISGIIGQGGMGVVMKGRDVSLDRFVAIKVLSPAYAGHSAARKRFAREAQAAAAVLHDNVIAIYGVDQWNDMPYLVMPYIKGESLQQRIDRAAPMSIEDILGISLQIARGLAAAHDQGLVHRDIKPANILMPASVSRVIITDFGLARTADDASLTRSGVLAGTPQYMSPEQAKGEAVDGRTDLFSLGSVMYAMACGRPPFRAETPYGVLRKITDQAHRPLSQLREDLPGWMGETIDRLLEKDPSRRFNDAHALADYLEDCLAHLRQPTTTLLPALQPTRKHRPVALFRGLLVAVVLVGGWFAIDRLTNQQVPRNQTGEHDTSNPSASPRSNPLLHDGDQTHLRWEFDTTPLDELETELDLLLEQSATDPFADPSSISE